MVSLYLKYRPLRFDDIVDQEMPKRALRNAVALGKTSHAYLFCGPRGTGKTSLARILAKALVCASPTKEGNPCGQCAACTAVQNGTLVDIIEIDAASHRGIDEIRALKERIHFAPTQAAKKVYIIDEVHMLTKDAFNALLKTLEEPPAHVHFILATTEIHKVLDTIISRCQRYDFRRITDEAVTDRLVYIAEQEQFSFDRDALALIARAANGGLRDAIRSLEQLSHTGMYALEDVQRFLGHAGMSRIEELLDMLFAGALSDALRLLETLHQNGVQMRELCKELMFTVRSRMMEDITAGTMTHVQAYLRLLDVLTIAREQLRGAMIEQLPMEIACIRFCQPEGAQVIVPPRVESAVKATPAPVVKNAPVLQQAPVMEPLPEEFPIESLPMDTVVAEPIAPSEKPSVPSSSLNDLFDDLLAPRAATPEVAVSSTPTPEVLPSVPSVTTTAGTPELAHVQQEWKKFCNTVKKSSVKFCLREGRPIALEHGRLVIAFSTKFSMEKVMETVNRDEVYTALRAFFGAEFELAGEVQGANPLPVKEDAASPAPSDDVFSVFGGSTMV